MFLIGDAAPVQWNDLVRLVGKVMDVPVRITHLPFWPVWIAAAACEGICRPLGVSPPLFRRRAEMFSHVRAFDISRARRVLGYEPKVVLEEGLRRTYDWYRSAGYL
ncbi:MAG: hypothetical protein ACREQY_13810 [Candidatus Binatia bacterium]